MDATISQRDLRNDSGAVLRRVEQGESLTVTRNGTPVADLVPHRPATRPPRFVRVDTIASSAARLPSWRSEQFGGEIRELDDALDDQDRDPWQSR